MAIPSLFDSYIDETYQRLVQYQNGEFADGTGSAITFGQTPTGSLLVTASATGNTITFIKGDGSPFNVTVAGGTGAPGGPNTSIQFNGNGVFSGSSNFTYNSGSKALYLSGSFNTQLSGSELFLIKDNSSNIIVSISSSGNTDIYSNLFIIKNPTTQQPVLIVSQSIVQFVTQSSTPTGTTQAGSIWFTSTDFYVGLE